MPTLFWNEEIRPSEYIDNCDNDDIEELIDELKNRGLLNQSSFQPVNQYTPPFPTDWRRSVAKLLKSDNSMLLTVEEEQTIMKIASRFL